MKIFDRFLDFVYPKKCIFCGKVVPFNFYDLAVCDVCQKDIPYLKENTCKKCGVLNEMRPGLDYCERCLTVKYSFVRNFAAFVYRDVRTGIKRFKYGRAKYLGTGFAYLMKDYIDITKGEIVKDVDVIIPVPICSTKSKSLKTFINSLFLGSENPSKNSSFVVLS